MTRDEQPLIDGYLDETLGEAEHSALAQWIRESPENAVRFARAVLLHDRLRNEHLALAESRAEVGTVPVEAAAGASPSLATSSSPPSAGRRSRSAVAIACAAVAAVLAAFATWQGAGDGNVSAAVGELDRLIAANARPADRSYRIAVEEEVAGRGREEGPSRPEDRRPPKPPLDGAVLHVGGGGRFVLVRTTADGRPFVTGCDGRASWAVRPDGPVRCSPDLNRFNRDLPGHEHSMPLVDVRDGLERLRAAYDIALLPGGADDAEDGEPGASVDPQGLLVAVKKPGFRGPRRVEIAYSAGSGSIRQMRFVGMPYGPDRLTLRLTLVEERSFSPGFFDHGFHHAPDRPVEHEE